MRVRLAAILISSASVASLHAGTIEIVSLNSKGEQANYHAAGAVAHAGRFVLLSSSATNLVERDTNRFADLFLHDRQVHETRLVSVLSNGHQLNAASYGMLGSADGRFAAFHTSATNAVPGFPMYRVFVHDCSISETTCVSVSSSGELANQECYLNGYAISADARFVVFESGATNLVPGGSNGALHIYLHDRETGETTRVSVTSSGQQAEGDCQYGSISGDASAIAFYSWANNLAGTHCDGGVFVHDRITGLTTCASPTWNGTTLNDGCIQPKLSHDARYVAFVGFATNLVPGDTNGQPDIFVFDRELQLMRRVSVASDGAQANGPSDVPSISGNGRYVVFKSDATNLVPGDTNGQPDIFMHDLQTSQTTRISLTHDDQQPNNGCSLPTISFDGRFIAFVSWATNLVPNDTNGFTDVFVADRGPQSPLGDVTGDGLANFDDILEIIFNFGACPASPPEGFQPCPADIYPDPFGDGQVNFDDILMVIMNWS